MNNGMSSTTIIGELRDIDPNGPRPRLELYFTGDLASLPPGHKDQITLIIYGTIWAKYQVAQLCRLMSTLLEGGIPLMTALETTSESLGSRLMRDSMEQARARVREGQPLSQSLAETGVFPSLAIEMINAMIRTMG